MKKILAVTGCPTGIAHTYMAQESLEVAAKELGVEIKVETNGAIGAENELTAADINSADAIIVACDKTVDMDRFNGKPVLEVSVTDGINKAKELIQLCLDGKVPVRGGAKQSGAVEVGKQSVGHTIYKHLMNGVSHMLPLVVAGGVLTAISFLWGIYSFDPTSSQYNEIAASIKEIGGVAMGLMVPIFTAFIAQSIAGRPGMITGFVTGMLANSTGGGFLGGILGGFATGYFVLFLVKSMRKMPRSLEGLKSIFILPIVSVFVMGAMMLLLGEPISALNQAMMDFLKGLQDSNPFILGIVVGCMSAFDMGGPVNKAAYVTGTALLAEGNFYFMAGVSAACITPPLVIAIAATFFKDRFTSEDRTAGLINYILGCTHITEGAIPFAAKNPLKVLPVLMIASSISAVLTYMMKVQVPAPHGGFLILGIVNEPFIWVGCILIGSVVGAVLYRFVTPKVEQETTITETISENTIDFEELFDQNTITIDLKSTNKNDVIDEMIALLDENGMISNKEEFKVAILEREAQASTAVGSGIAIPHARTNAVKKANVAVGISKNGFDYDAPDGEKCNLIFMIAAKETDGNLHLQTLANLSKKLIHEEFIDALRNCPNEKEVLTVLSTRG
ncbi:fructose-specific PTS transporter subunit EIIC [Breznakia pachnodae]|uniref:PTS system fructose-specific IIC component n=1 Tax=Breznakia pachnodae TaxID=265178 RepID=A0ABU0E4R0_9FIRM|nr:fructose-specific PTS transporter subunit EIIC [Breznakia pachnodae]MDQ0361490.1 PTS system fructose-specific IIC component [Breznakia pachnodae]